MGFSGLGYSGISEQRNLYPSITPSSDKQGGWTGYLTGNQGIQDACTAPKSPAGMLCQPQKIQWREKATLFYVVEREGNIVLVGLKSCWVT